VIVCFSRSSKKIETDSGYPTAGAVFAPLSPNQASQSNTVLVRNAVREPKNFNLKFTGHQLILTQNNSKRHTLSRLELFGELWLWFSRKASPYASVPHTAGYIFEVAREEDHQSLCLIPKPSHKHQKPVLAGSLLARVVPLESYTTCLLQTKCQHMMGRLPKMPTRLP